MNNFFGFVASSMKITFRWASGCGAVGTTPKLIAAAFSRFRTFAMVGTISGARFRSTIVAGPRLSFKSSKSSIDWIANTFTSRSVTRPVFNNTSVTQFTFETDITNAFAFLASTVFKTIVAAIFHLTTVTRKITNAGTRTVDAFAVSFFFMAIAWTFRCTTIDTGPRSKTFDAVVVFNHAVSWTNVLGLARGSSPSRVAFASGFLCGWTE